MSSIGNLSNAFRFVFFFIGASFGDGLVSKLISAIENSLVSVVGALIDEILLLSSGNSA